MHAGLEKGKNVEEQLKHLKAKDTGVSKVEALSGRKNVWDIPQVIDQCSLLLIVCTLTELSFVELFNYSKWSFSHKSSLIVDKFVGFT